MKGCLLFGVSHFLIVPSRRSEPAFDFLENRTHLQFPLFPTTFLFIYFFLISRTPPQPLILQHKLATLNFWREEMCNRCLVYMF